MNVESIVEYMRKQMKKYKIAIENTTIEFWEVEAENIRDAEENYMGGECVSTKPKQDEFLWSKEITGEDVNENT